MEVHRGVCIFCHDHNHRIITPSDAQEFIDLIPHILGKNFLNELEFQKVKDSLKICSICCYKFSVVNATKTRMDNSHPENPCNSECYFCSKESHLVRVERDWKYFHDRTEGVYDLAQWKIVFICLDCLFYLDAAFSIRNKLFAKHPQVQLEGQLSRRSNSLLKQAKSPQTAALKRISTRISSSTTKRKLHDCFEQLEPLSAKSYRIDKEYKSDAQLYKQIPYVNLKSSSKTAPIPKSDRPKIKIKLIAPKSKKERIVKDNNKNNSSTKHLKDKSYVDLSKVNPKTAEVLSKKKKKGKKTNDPIAVISEENNKNDDTQEITKNVPQRRPSFVEPSNEEIEEDASKKQSPLHEAASSEEETETVPEAEPQSVALENADAESSTPEESNDNVEIIIQKYVNDIKLNEPEKEEETGVIDLTLNGNAIESQQDDDKPVNLSEEDEVVDLSGKDDNEKEESDKEVTELTMDKDVSFIYSDLDGKTSEAGSDRDSVSGSERKKKRVTFSDDI